MRLKSRGLQAVFSSEAQGLIRTTWLWQNYFPYGCRTEVPVSLLAVSWEPHSASRRNAHSKACIPFHLQSQQNTIKSYSSLKSLSLPIIQRVLDIRVVVPSASDSEGGAIRLRCEGEVVGGRWLLLSAESAKHQQQHQQKCVSL